MVVDAKYKRHWEELQEHGWQGQDEDLREQHRTDLLQILAYANLVPTKQVVCCLVYPCSAPTWESLARRGRLFHCSELPNRGRRICVCLTAIPNVGGHRAHRSAAERETPFGSVNPVRWRDGGLSSSRLDPFGDRRMRPMLSRVLAKMAKMAIGR